MVLDLFGGIGGDGQAGDWILGNGYLPFHYGGCSQPEKQKTKTNEKHQGNI